MKLRPNTILLGLLAASFVLPAYADDDAQADGGDAFELGQITVQGRRSNVAADERTISSEDIRRANSQTIADALSTQPGVSVDFIGARNETGLRLRGYDSRQVPLFLDGIPQYVPYDGYVDFARFLTPGLSEIRVAKSGASLMYGPNTLGGAINLVSRKPQKAFEGEVVAGIDDASGKNLSLNLGSNTGRSATAASAARSSSRPMSATPPTPATGAGRIGIKTACISSVIPVSAKPTA